MCNASKRETQPSYYKHTHMLSTLWNKKLNLLYHGFLYFRNVDEETLFNLIFDPDPGRIVEKKVLARRFPAFTAKRRTKTRHKSKYVFLLE